MIQAYRPNLMSVYVLAYFTSYIAKQYILNSTYIPSQVYNAALPIHVKALGLRLK